MAAPRPQFYHPAKLIDAALHGIDRAIRRAEGIAVVVGPPGTGKSLLLAKVAEAEADDFSVALLSGARICTRRALWQSILADLGQAYRGIDEAELRIAVVEIVRGLANRGSGLVILVDEAHTLPLRLLEELRLLTNIPTPLPAVHIVLAGTSLLEERIGGARMESLAQRIAVRAYLEPLDHGETLAYLRTQTRAAGIEWDACFEPGCDDAVYKVADGVPRLVNQVCDQALVIVAGAGRRVRPADVAAAWREIQRLPGPLLQDVAAAAEPAAEPAPVAAAVPVPGGMGGNVIEFGTLDDVGDEEPADDETALEFDADVGGAFADAAAHSGIAGLDAAGPPVAVDPWRGPDVEFVFDASNDPFAEYFEQEERVVERYLIRSPADFSGCRPVVSAEGAGIVRQLAELGEPVAEPVLLHAAERSAEPPVGAAGGGAGGGAGPAPGDDDMVVIEEDLLPPPGARPTIAAVRLGDYRRLFARLRRGG
jgi:type II secretory pathway predicted ATPase ExeA